MVEESFKVLLAEEDYLERSFLVEALSTVEKIKMVAEVRDEYGLWNLLEHLQIDGLVLSITLTNDLQTLTDQIKRLYPHVAIFLKGKSTGTQELKAALQVGASGFLSGDMEKSQIAETMLQGFYRFKWEKEALLKEKGEKEEKESYSCGKMVAFFSPKGGVGKTFLAANLAVALAVEGKKKVALWDLDLEFGNVNLFLDIMEKQLLSELAGEEISLDMGVLENFLVEHNSGVTVLPAPTEIDFQVDSLSIDTLSKIGEILKQNFDYVIVDLPSSMGKEILPALEMADVVLMVATLELSALYSLKTGLELLEALSYPRSKLKLLLNKSTVRSEINARDLEEMMKIPLYGSVPSDEELVVTSINKGLPLVTMKPRAAISRELLALSRKIVRETAAQEPEVRESKKKEERLEPIFKISSPEKQKDVPKHLASGENRPGEYVPGRMEYVHPPGITAPVRREAGGSRLEPVQHPKVTRLDKIRTLNR